MMLSREAFLDVYAKRRTVALGMAVFLLVATIACRHASAAMPPNVLLILADDK